LGQYTGRLDGDRCAAPSGRWLVRGIKAMSELPDFLRPFKSAAELAAHVEDALRETVPSGWRALRICQGELAWVIEQIQFESRYWDTSQYSLFATPDLRFLIVTYGNTDAGPLSEAHCIHNAKVIDAYGAKQFGLAGYLREIFAKCEPNKICLT
jgi:hypothetical protein